MSTDVSKARSQGRSDAKETIGDQMSAAFAEVATRLGTAGIAPAGPAFACYHPSDDGFDVDAGFTVPDSFAAPPGLARLHLDPREVAHTTHVGPYSELPSAYEDLQTEVTRRGRVLDGTTAMWEEYWSPPGTPDDETRTVVFCPLVPAS